MKNSFLFCFFIFIPLLGFTHEETEISRYAKSFQFLYNSNASDLFDASQSPIKTEFENKYHTTNRENKVAKKPLLEYYYFGDYFKDSRNCSKTLLINTGCNYHSAEYIKRDSERKSDLTKIHRFRKKAFHSLISDITYGFHQNDSIPEAGSLQTTEDTVISKKYISQETFQMVYENDYMLKLEDSLHLFSWMLVNKIDIAYKSIDTSLNDFQIYNSALNRDYTFSQLGNIGQPAINKRYQPLHFTFLQAFDHYLYKSYNTQYFNVRSPYTKLAYTTGPQKEQTLEAFHTQNINKYWNVGALYHNHSGEGLLIQENSKGNRFNIFSSFNSRRYDAYFSFVRNKFEDLENGGIIDDSYVVDSINLSDDIEDLDQIPVNLENAKNTFLNKEFNFYHEYKIGKKKTYYFNDSLSKEKYFSPVSIIHFYNTYNYYKIYEDKQRSNSFYTNIYNNTSTFDSAYYGKRIHGFGLKLNTTRIGNFMIKSGIFYQDQKERYGFFNKDTLFDNTIDTNIYSKALEGVFKIKMNRKYHIDFNGTYHFHGHYKGNLYTSLEVNQFLGKANQSKLGIRAAYNMRMPSYFLDRYASNHFKWHNNFSKNKYREAELHFMYANNSWDLKATLSAMLHDNTIYFDENAYPRHSDKAFSVYSAEIEKTFTLWKIKTKHRLLYQTSENTTTISIPEFVYYNASYFEDELFFKSTGGKMLLQLGFDLYYHTKYYSNAYMPATGQFYLQREKEYGNYPLFNAFLNVKIKRMRIFLKMEHVNEGLFERNYFATKHYPLHGAGFKLGLSWTFYD